MITAVREALELISQNPEMPAETVLEHLSDMFPGHKVSELTDAMYMAARNPELAIPTGTDEEF